MGLAAYELFDNVDFDQWFKNQLLGELQVSHNRYNQINFIDLLWKSFKPCNVYLRAWKTQVKVIEARKSTKWRFTSKISIDKTGFAHIVFFLRSDVTQQVHSKKRLCATVGSNPSSDKRLYLSFRCTFYSITSLWAARGFTLSKRMRDEPQHHTGSFSIRCDCFWNFRLVT